MNHLTKIYTIGFIVACAQFQPFQMQAAEVAPLGPLSAWIDAGMPIRAEVITVKHAEGIGVYQAKIARAVNQHPEHFKEVMSKQASGSPLAWDDKIGLTKEEYDAYIKLWNQRKIVVVSDAALEFEKTSKGNYKMRVGAPPQILPSGLAFMEFDPKSGNFHSINGEMKRIQDIDAPKDSILGAWKGVEWRFAQSDDLAEIRENLAVGLRSDGKSCYMVYRFQELSVGGVVQADQSIILRFSSKAK